MQKAQSERAEKSMIQHSYTIVKDVGFQKAYGATSK